MLSNLLSARNILIGCGLVFVFTFFLSAESDIPAEEEKSESLTGLVIAPFSTPRCGDSLCSYPETQLDCPIDCQTRAGINLIVGEGQEAGVFVEFWDSRYKRGQNVQIDLTILPENITWTPYNGCFFGGIKMGPEPGNGVIGWPSNTISRDGYFRIETTCTLPESVKEGSHKLLASVDIIF
jgi:hypothetical protein